MRHADLALPSNRRTRRAPCPADACGRATGGTMSNMPNLADHAKLPPAALDTTPRIQPQTQYTPPERHEAGDLRRGVTGTTRRVLERFALVAFGLYHLPLFLNNYPSLGGGGFNDNGLAVRWGHLFTPPGIWVARHLFHVAGPMPNGSRGDNGDVAEEFGRLVVCVAIAVVVAVWWTLADRRKPRAAWVSETLRVLLRYSIALGLASYGISKILPMQFPPLDPVRLQQRVGDLSPMALLWTFMEYSRPYAFFGGLMEAAVVVLLCVRRTAMLGALTCLAVMVNVALLNWAYGVPVKLYSTMLVVSAAVLLLYDLPRLYGFFVKDAPLPAAPTVSFIHERIPARWRWTIKLLLVGSVCLSSVAAMESILSRQSPRPATVDSTYRLLRTPFHLISE